MSQDDDNMDFIRTVYRGCSPTVARQENRIKELEELLDLERESRKRLEKNNIELDEQLTVVTSQVDECSVSSGQFNEAIRRRDADIQRLRKELDRISLAMETSEQELRKKSHVAVMDMKNEVEGLQKQRLKMEKDKVVLLKELETILVKLDVQAKLKMTLESRLENSEGQLARTKATVDELERQMKDLGVQKSSLVEENSTLKITVKDVSHQNSSLRRCKSSLELQLDESKKMAEEEMRQREILQSTSHLLHSDNEQLRMQLEDAVEVSHRLQHQLAKVNGDLSLLKGKYEKDVSEKSLEFEELKRKNVHRINELTEEAAREHSKANSLEKSRQQLARDVVDLNADLERMDGELSGLQHDLKTLEAGNNELTNQLQELELEITSLRMTNAKISSENTRLRNNLEEEEHKNHTLTKENNVLSSLLRDEKEVLHAVSKELIDAQAARSQLESDRANLLSALEENKEILLDTERRYQSSQCTLLQLKTDVEQRLSEKNEELDALRKNSQRTIEDLSASLTELEGKYKTEITKMKKKYETQCKQMQDNLDVLQKENIELSEELQETCDKGKELENALEEERQEFQLVQEKFSASERRRVQLQGDLEDSNRLLEAADKSRKNIQMEIEETSMKFADCIAQINSLSNERRKLENEIAALKEDIEDLSARKTDNEERVAGLSNEVNVLTDELRQEREENKKVEVARKNAVSELKETKTRLDQRESSTVKETARNTQMFQEKIRELEIELEFERARSKEVQIAAKKQDRTMRDLQQQADDERSTRFELQQLLDAAQTKMKTFKRQMDELELTNAESLSKYRRALKQIDEAEKTPTTDRRIGVTLSPTSSLYLSSYSRTTGAR